MRNHPMIPAHRLARAVCALAVGFLASQALVPDAHAQERPLAIAPAGLPEIPQPSARQARWVGLLERTARRSLRCVMEEGDRGGEIYADERCWEWYDRLESAGVAGAHATGRVLLATVEPSPELVGDPVARLVEILGASHSEVAAPYLLHLLARAGGTTSGGTELASLVLGALDRLTGADVMPIAPWQSRYEVLAAEVARAEQLQAWLTWYRDAGQVDYRAWRRAAVETARARLSNSDPVVRFAAIQRLKEDGRDHSALVTSVSELIASPSLGATARRYISRYAGREGLLSRAEIRALARS